MKILVPLIMFLLFTGCGSQGWVVANIPLDSEDTYTNTVFIEIVDADSVVHWFHGRISDYSNWCYKHQRLEEVEVK
jgi:uncharacterized lipoprotein YajG